MDVVERTNMEMTKRRRTRKKRFSVGAWKKYKWNNRGDEERRDIEDFKRVAEL